MNLPTETKLSEYEFSIELAESVSSDDALEDLAEKVYSCDSLQDSCVGGNHGVAFVDFTRKASSFLQAVSAAIADLEDAGVSPTKVRPEPFLNAAEIARRIGRSKESIRKLRKGLRGPGNFPASVMKIGRSEFWHWDEVSEWFAHFSGEATIDTLANDVRFVNALLELARQTGQRFNDTMTARPVPVTRAGSPKKGSKEGEGPSDHQERR